MSEFLSDEQEFEKKHHHEYRRDIADWWCHNCDTVTDFCTQLNDFGQDIPFPPEG